MGPGRGRPLVAIADCLGDEWGALARAAAAAISGKNTNDRTIGVLLLKDLRELFQQQVPFGGDPR